MFTRLSPQHFYLSLKLTRLYAPRRRHPTPNAGITNQLKMFKELPETIEDPEAINDFEADFMNVHQSHKQYELETLRHKEQIRLWIIKNKYFKVKQPNFLTYTEKEQIKLLHNRNPNEWTSEKLAESFPADVETITKVIKANWTTSSKERILKHDEAVMRNWSLYKEGKLKNLNDSLKAHIDKFADRKIEDLKNMRFDRESKPSLPTPKINEFSKIITSCKKYANESKMIESSDGNDRRINDRRDENIRMNQNMKNTCPGEDETFLIDKVVDRRYMRYEDVKRIKNLQSSDENESECDDKVQANRNEIEVKTKETQNPFSNIQETQNPLSNIEKFESREVEISREDMKKYDVTPIKQKIHIPKKLWRKDATYKVIDCYYDDDGEFLYRVPGMSGKNVN